jgi:hypothetical protein
VDGDNSRARQGEVSRQTVIVVSASDLFQHQSGYLPYLSDLYGCHTYLASKRRHRNYDARYPPYYLSCRELRPLLEWCPSDHTQLFSDPLPWSAG